VYCQAKLSQAVDEQQALYKDNVNSRNAGDFGKSSLPESIIDILRNLPSERALGKSFTRVIVSEITNPVFINKLLKEPMAVACTVADIHHFHLQPYPEGPPFHEPMQSAVASSSKKPSSRRTGVIIGTVTPWVSCYSRACAVPYAL